MSVQWSRNHSSAHFVTYVLREVGAIINLQLYYNTDSTVQVSPKNQTRINTEISI
jgi:hypothetical protein